MSYAIPFQISSLSCCYVRFRTIPFTVDTIPGAIAPTGVFDPLSFAEKADENTLKRYREAELTHGRVVRTQK